ncbi:hypothetical protein M427DRAFT_52430 [Gonapodya prolifera JEL478]|uniref:Endoplasmic reticulum-based factor for assembly of V-ATPase n=1 Tax=Gonapodya prolifera (strain JEL478) TaxID=1344416 RepID=A0A139AUC9_GONPJ|nr:hypothetical protein M427DRAFT_52430 [Gonapodya prolifera JEL478]|eukprot:KXS20173.1 hypothetical protein M427DRAFT_52430 [Gonapodya prolifera JEL478]
MVELHITRAIQEAALAAISQPNLDTKLRKRLVEVLKQEEGGDDERQDNEDEPGDTIAMNTDASRAAEMNDVTSVVHNKADTSLSRKQPTISHQLLKELSDFLVQNVDSERDRYGFWKLSRGCLIHVDRPPPRVKSAQLLAILEDIRVKQENAKYYTQESRSLSLGQELRAGALELRGGIKMAASVANVVFSVGGMGYGAFYVSSQLHQDPGMRALFGLLVAGVTLLAEAWFFYFYYLRDEVDKDESKIKRET